MKERARKRAQRGGERRRAGGAPGPFELALGRGGARHRPLRRLLGVLLRKPPRRTPLRRRAVPLIPLPAIPVPAVPAVALPPLAQVAPAAAAAGGRHGLWPPRGPAGPVFEELPAAAAAAEPSLGGAAAAGRGRGRGHAVGGHDALVLGGPGEGVGAVRGQDGPQERDVLLVQIGAAELRNRGGSEDGSSV